MLVPLNDKILKIKFVICSHAILCGIKIQFYKRNIYIASKENYQQLRRTYLITFKCQAQLYLSTSVHKTSSIYTPNIIPIYKNLHSKIISSYLGLVWRPRPSIAFIFFVTPITPMPLAPMPTVPVAPMLRVMTMARLFMVPMARIFTPGPRSRSTTSKKFIKK